MSNEYEGFPQVFEITYDDVKKYGKVFLENVKAFHEKVKLV